MSKMLFLKEDESNAELIVVDMIAVDVIAVDVIVFGFCCVHILCDCS
jgi:hypothetical protein